MAHNAINSRHLVRKDYRNASTAFHPGGWGDRIVFGYMFRVLSSLVAVIFPALLLLIWGFLNNWQLSDGMLYFFGITVVGMVSIGEAMRLGVYESRLKPLRHVEVDDYAGVTREFLEKHGHAKITYRMMKRFIDVTISSFAVITMIPLFITAALIIRFDSPGPVIFSQIKVGRGGQLFRMFKFRTLSIYAGEGTPNVTRAGRFMRRTSLDELPQFFNVLLGDMSLVGPRPLSLTRSHKQVLSENIKSTDSIDVAVALARYAKPGITGVSMLEGDHPNSVLAYILKRSVAQDFRILFKAISRFMTANN